jgi:hypothetical protein
MPDRYRSRSSHSREDLISSQQLEEIELIVESVKNGFNLGSPFRAVVHGIMDFCLLLRHLLQEGIYFDLSTINVRLKQNPKDPLIFEYANEVNKGSTGGEGQPNWFHSGTVASTKQVIKSPFLKFGESSLNSSLEEWLDTTIHTLAQISVNPKADPNFMIGKPGVHQNAQKKLQKENYWFYRRAERIKHTAKHIKKNAHDTPSKP